MDLRERIVAACAEGATHTSVAQRFGVCTKTVQRYVARAARGELAPRPVPGRVRVLNLEQTELLRSLVAERTDWTLESLSSELAKRCAVEVKRSTLHLHLQRLGISFKKKRASP